MLSILVPPSILPEQSRAKLSGVGRLQPSPSQNERQCHNQAAHSLGNIMPSCSNNSAPLRLPDETIQYITDTVQDIAAIFRQRQRLAAEQERSISYARQQQINHPMHAHTVDIRHNQEPMMASKSVIPPIKHSRPDCRTGSLQPSRPDCRPESVHLSCPASRPDSMQLSRPDSRAESEITGWNTSSSSEVSDQVWFVPHAPDEAKGTNHYNRFKRLEQNRNLQDIFKVGSVLIDKKPRNFDKKIKKSCSRRSTLLST